MTKEQEIEMLKGLCKLITDRYRLCELYEKDCTNLSRWYASPSIYIIWGKSPGTSIYNKRQILSTEFEVAKERLIDVLNSDSVIMGYLKDLDIYEINPDYIRSNIDCIWTELSKNLKKYCLESLINNLTMGGNYNYYQPDVSARLIKEEPSLVEEAKRMNREHEAKRKPLVVSDEVACFLNEQNLGRDELIGQRIGPLYERYLDWNSYEFDLGEPVSKTKFTQSIKTMYGLKTKKVRKGQALDRAFTE